MWLLVIFLRLRLGDIISASRHHAPSGVKKWGDIVVVKPLCPSAFLIHTGRRPLCRCVSRHALT